METAIYSTAGLILVSLLSGLAYLAVKFPTIYNKLGKKLLIGICGFAFFGFGFSTGLGVSTSVAQSYIGADRLGAFYSVMTDIQIGGAIAAAATLAFACFLYILAKIGADIYRHEREKNHEDEEAE